jgi:hypothetical protein
MSRAHIFAVAVAVALSMPGAASADPQPTATEVLGEGLLSKWNQCPSPHTLHLDAPKGMITLWPMNRKT